MTFQERKAQRVQQQIADKNKKFKYQVVCTSFYLPDGVDPVLPQLFDTADQARRFAYQQIGNMVGRSAAVDQVNRMIPKNHIPFPDCAGKHTFSIKKIECQV